jgi:hypothetical protein
MIEQLIPASANMSSEIRNMIESHILERNKYWTKYPTLEMKLDDPIDSARGINELLYRWDIGHAPVDGDEDTKCLWQKERKERLTPTALSASRNSILSVTRNTFNRKLDTPLNLTSQENKIYKGGSNSGRNKKGIEYLLSFINERFNTEGYYKSRRNEIIDDVCNDATSSYKTKRNMGWDKVPIETNEYDKGNMNIHLPFSLYTSSEDSKGWNYVGMHIDSYGDNNEVPIQGPFTEKWVGGLQYRHVRVNTQHTGGTTYKDDENSRPEGYRVYRPSSNEDFIVGPEKVNGLTASVRVPRATFYRDGLAKRPLNVANIRTTLTKSFDHATLSGLEIQGDLGNYYNTWEIVQTSDRSINNSFLTKNEGITGSGANILFSGTLDYPKNQRGKHKHVFVERFSAPGGQECMGDANGGIGLDAESGQFSVYNSMNNRNMTVRGKASVGGWGYFKPREEGLDFQWRRHCGKFGIHSRHSVLSESYTVSSASYHKVFRNTLRRLEYTSSNYGQTLDVSTVYPCELVLLYLVLSLLSLFQKLET